METKKPYQLYEEEFKKSIVTLYQNGKSQSQLSKEYSIESLCYLINVSRSGYYKWLKRKGILNRYENDRLLLSNMIISLHKKHSTWGYWMDILR